MGNSKSKPHNNLTAASSANASGALLQPHTTVTVQQVKSVGKSHKQDVHDSNGVLSTPKKKNSQLAGGRCRVPNSEEKYRSPEPEPNQRTHHQHNNQHNHHNQYHDHADENADLSVGGSGITTPRQHKKHDHRKGGGATKGMKKSKAKEKNTLPPPSMSMDTTTTVTQSSVSSTAASSTPRALSTGTAGGGPIVFPDGHPLSVKPVGAAAAAGGSMSGSSSSSLPGSRRGSVATSTIRPILVKQQSHVDVGRPTPTILVRVGSRRGSTTSTEHEQEQVAQQAATSKIASVTRVTGSDDSNPSSLAPSVTSSASDSTETSPTKDAVSAASQSHDVAPVSSRGSKHVPPFLTQAIVTVVASSAAASSEPTPRMARSISLPPLPTPRSVSTIMTPSHQQQQQPPQTHRRPSSLTVHVDSLTTSPIASPLATSMMMMSRPAVLMDSFAWQRTIDPFTPNCSKSLKFDTTLYGAQSKSLILAMSLSALLHPTRTQLELLWQYCDSIHIVSSSISPTMVSNSISQSSSLSPSPSSPSPFSSSSGSCLGKHKLLVLASELHAKLFLLTIDELKSQRQLYKWKKIHDILMKERPFLLPKEGKVKKSLPPKSNHQDEEDIIGGGGVKGLPHATPLQLAHLKSTVAILLRLMDLNGDHRISRQEFLTGWPLAAEALLGQKSKVDADGKRKADGVIACNIM